MGEDHYSFITGCELYSGKNSFKKKDIHDGHSENWNLLLIERGKVVLTIDEVDISFVAGDVLLIKPGPLRFFTSSAEGWSSEWCHFNLTPHINTPIKWKAVSPFTFKIKPEPEEFRRFKQILSELRKICKVRRIGWYELGYCLIQEMLLYGNMISSPGLDQQSIKTTLKAFDLQPFKKAEDMAKICAISRTSFFNKFKESFGVAPGKYREDQKMSHALDLLLKENKTISEIASDLNYCSAFYFSNRFKKYYGISPSEYKKKYRKSNLEEVSEKEMKPE